MSSWHRYPSPKALGHAMCKDVMDGNVIIQEKVDGSQFSFGSFEGELKIRSRGRKIDLDVPDKMFKIGIDYVKKLHKEGKLVNGFMYSGEYLNKPKHNTLAYDRTPPDNIILFDIRYDDEQYIRSTSVKGIAADLGLWSVPLLWEGKGSDVTPELIEELMKTKSVLGGKFNVEGIVIKNYDRFSPDGKVQMAKVVSAEFKEKHGSNKAFKNTTKDVVEDLVVQYKTEARWRKAIQHLDEEGRLEGSPKDIGDLIKEVQVDVYEEAKEEIMKVLFQKAWPKIERGIIKGLPQWYKDKLQSEFWEKKDDT